MDSGLNIQIKETNKTQYINLDKAVATDEGKIRLEDGRLFSVQLFSEGKPLAHLSGEELKALANKALKILRETGQNFETLNSLSINKNKIDHLKQGKTETIQKQGEEKWAKTAEKVINKFLSKFSINKKERSESSPPSILKVDVKEKANSNKIQEKKTEEEVHQESVHKLIKNSQKGILDLSSDMFALLSKKNPEIKEKIDEFQKDHPKKMEILKEKGWIALKKDPELGGIKMAQKEHDPDGKGMSFEDFRKATNTLVVDLVNLAMKDMGMPTINAGGAGTPGYNSDVDLNMKSKESTKPLSTGEMVVARTLANMISTKILGQMPGLAIDTEWYVDRKFLGEQVQTPEAKQQIATLDLAMGIMQAKEGFKEHPEQYNDFKNKQINDSPKEIGEVKKQLFEQAEALYEKMELQTEKELLLQEKVDISNLTPKEIHEKVAELQKSDLKFSEKYYKAKVVAQYRSHLELGKECALLEKEIEEGQKNGMPEDQLDALIVKHDIIYALINCTQAEGTMSSSELQTTLDSRLGQIAQRNLEKDIKKSKEMEKTTPKNLKGKKGLRALRKSLDNFEKGRNLGTEYTIPQLLLAGQERLAQFSHKIQEDHKEAPIEAGKYCLRVAESNYYALQKFKDEKEDNNLPEGFDKLFEQAQENYQQAKDLEQAKRSFFLNAPTTKSFLADILGSKPKNFDEILQKESNIIANTGGLVRKAEKMRVLLDGLENKNYIQEDEKKLLLKKPIGEKPESMDNKRYQQLKNLQHVLHARVGYKKEKPEYLPLNQLHSDSKPETLKAHGLENKSEVLNFAKKIESFTLEVQKFMHDNGVMPKLSQNFSDNHKFANIWPGK